MGLTWIAEIASWQTVKYGLVREEVWHITDIINSLQGVLVFYLQVYSLLAFIRPHGINLDR